MVFVDGVLVYSNQNVVKSFDSDVCGLEALTDIIEFEIMHSNQEATIIMYSNSQSKHQWGVKNLRILATPCSNGC